MVTAASRPKSTLVVENNRDKRTDRDNETKKRLVALRATSRFVIYNDFKNSDFK